MYYVNLDGAAYGPYTSDQVRAMAAGGKITARTLVFDRERGRDWMPLSKCPHLMRKPTRRYRDRAIDPKRTSTPLALEEVERPLWRGRPSNLVNFWFCVASGLVILGAGAAWWAARTLLLHTVPEAVTLTGYIAAGIIAITLLRVLYVLIDTKAMVWSVTTERLTFSTGLFSRRTENLEMYRIKDLTLRKPFWLRVLGYGYVDVISSDITNPRMKGIGPIRKAPDLYEIFRKHTERQRQLRGVREIDIGR